MKRKIFCTKLFFTMTAAVAVLVLPSLSTSVLARPVSSETLPSNFPKDIKVARISVHKSLHRMELLNAMGQAIKTYRVSLGNPVSHKAQEGDHRTPERTYHIADRNPHSAYHLSLRVSYPAKQDVRLAQQRGVSPGNDIMIHGLPNGQGWIGADHTKQDWTYGCIAVTDAEIEEIWKLVPDGTTIEIKP